SPMAADAWADEASSALALRRAIEDADGVDATLMLANGGGDPVRFRLPQPALDWERLLDTSSPDEPPGQPVEADEVEVAAHAVVLLGARADPHPPGDTP